MQKQSTTWIFILLVFLVPLLAYAGYTIYTDTFEKLPVYGKPALLNGKEADHQVPDFSLLDQEGRTANNMDWKGRIQVVDFFFTHCPSICPKMTNSLKKVQQSFKVDEIQLSSFSVDPERDSSAQLQWYADKFGINTSNWKLLTGDKREIYRLARNGFMLVATDGDGGPNDFIHSEKLVLVDKQKRIRGYYNGTDEKEVATLIRDIKKLQHEN